jgi:two-component system response regulator FixJ
MDQPLGAHGRETPILENDEKAIVLIVDDDRAVRTALKFMLELEGYTVHVCASGDELLHHPVLKNARCLLVDYKMPAMDGFEVIERLEEQNVHVPTILITSFVNKTLARRAAEVGVVRILEKPLLDSVLSENIRQILAG